MSDKKPSLIDIKKQIVEHFGTPVTVEKISEAFRSKTVMQARLIGVFLANSNGYNATEIAETFGYENDSSVSRALKTAEGHFKKNTDQFTQRVESIRNTF